MYSKDRTAQIQSTNAQLQEVADKAVQAVDKAMKLADAEVVQAYAPVTLTTADKAAKAMEMLEYGRKRPPYTPTRGWVECKSEEEKRGVRE